MNDFELRRLGELRALLEGFAARHAAANAAAEPAAAAALRDALRRLESATQRHDYAAFCEADHALHSGIVALAKVPRLAAVWEQVWSAQLVFHQRTFDACFPDARFLAREHARLVETIALGDPAAAEDAARSHVLAVWLRVAEQQGRQGGTEGDALQRAVAHIAFNLARPLRLEEVAARVAFTSSGNLSRLFRRRYGVGFQVYVQHLRLDKAAELLRATRLTVSQVARQAGYRDAARFGQHFKRRHGMTPSCYRGKAEAGEL